MFFQVVTKVSSVGGEVVVLSRSQPVREVMCVPQVEIRKYDLI